VQGPRSLIADGFHYIRHRDGGEELYALDRDPGDSLDLTSSPGGRAALPRLRAILDSIVGRRR
jgi:hypothetical protein